MKARFLILPLIVAGAIIAQDAAQTQTQTQTRPRTRPDPGAQLERMLTRFLQLDAAQQSQVHTILEEAKVANQGLPEKIRTLRKSLIDAVKANDTGQIDSLTQQIAAAEQQLSANRAKSAAKIYAILTESQKTVVGEGLGMLMGGFAGPMGPMGFGRGRGPGGRGPGGPPPAPQQ
jgi:Spy/CpxP family protein refolding chaperone